MVRNTENKFERRFQLAARIFSLSTDKESRSTSLGYYLFYHHNVLQANVAAVFFSFMVRSLYSGATLFEADDSSGTNRRTEPQIS